MSERAPVAVEDAVATCVGVGGGVMVPETVTVNSLVLDPPVAVMDA